MAGASEGTCVSVLIPCWNSAEFIERAIASVLVAETPVECIVVDDASTDDSVAIVQAIAERDPRVVLVTLPENVGVSAARNQGLRRVRGEWLTFLDSDDRLLDGGVDTLYRAAMATDALAVVGQRVWSDGERTWITEAYDRPDIREPGRKSLARSPGLMFYASVTGKLFHRSIREGLQFEGRVLGDQPWALRALLRAGDRIEVVGDTIYEWYRPRADHQFETITEVKRLHAARAADAVTVAIGALRDVGIEADRVLPDPGDAQSIRRHYFNRLVVADFRGPVQRGLNARDAGLAAFFDAMAAFLAAAPPDLVDESSSLRDFVLGPPVHRPDRLTGESTVAYLAMVRPLLRRNTGLPRSLGGSRPVRWGLRAARSLPGRAGLLVGSWLFALAAFRRRRVQRRTAPGPAQD